MIKYVGQGLYTLSQAGRILSEQPRTVRRWAFGYERRGREYPAVIETELPKCESSEVLTFLDVIELLSIRSFLSHGLSWRKVRDAAAAAARLLRGETHPFARREWFVDPAGLYLKLGREHDADLLVEVAGDAQVAMEEALRPYLSQLRFHDTGLASQWFPMGTDEAVVLDPRRAFGAPIVATGGVRTEVIHGHHVAGDSVQEISAYLDIPEHEVHAAIEYERDRAA